jgi:hypothetical protein
VPGQSVPTTRSFARWETSPSDEAELNWDPVKEVFKDDETANRKLARVMRSRGGWKFLDRVIG